MTWKGIAAIIGLVATFLIIMNIAAWILGFGGLLKHAYDTNPSFRSAIDQLKNILYMLRDALIGILEGLKVGE